MGEQAKRFPLRNTVILILSCFAVLVLVFVVMWNKIDSIIVTQIEDHVSSIGRSVAAVVNNTFDTELDYLACVAEDFVDMESSTIKDGIADKNGVSYGLLRINGEVADGEKINTSEYSGILDSLHGNPSVSSGDDGSVLFTVPVFNGINVKYVLYKKYTTDALAKKTELSLYNGMGQFAIVDIDGGFVLCSADGDMQADFFTSPDNAKAVEKIRDKMNIASSAASRSKGSGDNVLFAAETEYKSLYIMGHVPYAEAADGISLITPLVIWTFALLWLLLVIVALYLMVADKKARDCDEMRHAKILAENARKAKSDFLANMSHEIRTPINVVIGMNEMILRESDNQQVLEYAQNIEAASHTLLSTVNDILDFSKIESGKMEIIDHEYKLGELLNDAINMIEIKAEQKALKFEVSIDSNIPNLLYGDDIRIKQILLNLLNNAVKYTESGMVKLLVRGTMTDGENVALNISIEDTGIGIKQEDLTKLFEGFHRFELEKNRAIEGSGLGLAIAYRLAMLMNGRIKAESEYGKGSIFTLHIDQKIMSDEMIGSFEEKYRHSAQPSHCYHTMYVAPDAHVLVVDDNRMNLLVVKNLLKKTEINVTTCMNGSDALNCMANKKFDVIMLDHMMPGMDGIETLKSSKQMEINASRQTPVIALTANAVSGVKEMYLEAGFDDYMSKPIEGIALEKMLEKYIPQEKIIYNETFTEAVHEATGAVETPQEEYPLMDEQQGIRYCADSEDMYGEILSIFVEMYDDKLKELNKFFEQRDWHAYTVSIHALKSNSLNVGGIRLSKLCLSLETAGKHIGAGENIEQETEYILDNHNTAMTLYEETIEAAKQYLGKRGNQ